VWSFDFGPTESRRISGFLRPKRHSGPEFSITGLATSFFATVVLAKRPAGSIRKLARRVEHLRLPRL
jgi:hypothetical protein